MGKHNKGKKKVDQGGGNTQSAAHGVSWADGGLADLSLPPPAQELSPEPKPIRLIEQINTNNSQFPNASSPQLPQEDDAWGTQGSNNEWDTQGRGASNRRAT